MNIGFAVGILYLGSTVEYERATRVFFGVDSELLDIDSGVAFWYIGVDMCALEECCEGTSCFLGAHSSIG